MKPAKPGVWQVFFAEVKFGPMASWAGASAYAVYEFCQRNGIGLYPSYAAGGVTFAACAFLYLINPKRLDWMPPVPGAAQSIDNLAPMTAVGPGFPVRTLTAPGVDTRPVTFLDSESMAGVSVGVGPQGVPDTAIPEARRNFTASPPVPAFDPVAERIAELERQRAAAERELQALKGVAN